jgi:hypothetical protein
MRPERRFCVRSQLSPPRSVVRCTGDLGGVTGVVSVGQPSGGVVVPPARDARLVAHTNEELWELVRAALDG